MPFDSKDRVITKTSSLGITVWKPEHLDSLRKIRWAGMNEADYEFRTRMSWAIIVVYRAILALLLADATVTLAQINGVVLLRSTYIVIVFSLIYLGKVQARHQGSTKRQLREINALMNDSIH